MSSKMKKTARHIMGILLALLICVQPFLLYGMVSAEPAPMQDETVGELTPEPATPEPDTPVPETPTPVPETPTPVPDTPTPVPDTPTPVPDTPTPTPEVTPEPETPTPEPIPEVTPTPEVTPSPETPTPEPEITDVPEPTPEVTPVPEVTPTPTAEVTPVPVPDALELDSGVLAADGLTHIALRLSREGGYPANAAWKIEILKPDERAQLTASEPELAGAGGLAVRFSVEVDGIECDLTGSEAVFTGLDPALIDGGRLSLYRDYVWRKLDVQYSNDADSVGLAKAKFRPDRSGVLFFFNPAPEVTPEPETPVPEDTPTPTPEVTPAVGSLDTAEENLSGGVAQLR